MLTFSVQPDTVEDVQTEIQKWFGTRSKEKEVLCTFSRTPKESGLNIFISHSAHDDLRIRMVERSLHFQMNQKKLSLNLARFRISTAFEDERLCFKIDRDPDQEHWLVTSLLKNLSETRHPAFFSRMFRVVMGLERDLTSKRIEEATAAPTDQLVLLEALSSVPWASELAAEDPILAAKLRGLELRKDMLKVAGGTLTSETVAEVLDVSRQAVDKRRTANQLLALTQGKRGYSYPGFQFEDGKTLKGLEEVLAKLRSLDPWMKLRFFTSPHERLNQKIPMDVLRKGKVEDVVAVASAYGEQGAL
jgi:hypothetical protein